MKTFIATMLVSGLAGTLSACQDVCACPPLPALAVAYGTVRLSSGEALPDAMVQAYSAPAAGCHLDNVTVSYDNTRSGADGSFTLSLISGVAQDSICVFVFAIPPSGPPTLGNSDTTLVVLDFRYQGAVDSARVDPVLQLP